MKKIVLILMLAATAAAQGVNFTSSNLPIIIIDTAGQEIQNETRIMADMGIIFNGEEARNHVTDPWNNYQGQIGIEYRGTTSMFFPKKPYRIETVDSLGENRNVSLLGLPKENDWVLHNPYSDKSLIRNVLACHMARKLGRYASRTRLVELVLDGQYQGVYVLMEKIKRDKNRVNISRISDDDVSGGYIIKLDKTSGEHVAGWESGNVMYQYHYPKPHEITPAQETYIQDFMTRFETLAAQGDSTYRDMIDLDSFVDYFIVNEVSRNIDAYRLSAYMHKNKDSKDPRLHMGPVWDFNIAFCNVTYYSGNRIAGWNLDVLLERTTHEFTPPLWWKTVREDTVFHRLLTEKWNRVTDDWLNADSIGAVIDSLTHLLSEAQVRNFQRWPVLGEWVWPNNYVCDTYEEEINYLKGYINQRLGWMDWAIQGGMSSVISPGQPTDFRLEQNVPNPFNGETRIGFLLPKPSRITLEMFDIQGRKVRTVASGWYDAGYHRVSMKCEYLASGCYICRLRAGERVESIKINLVK